MHFANHTLPASLEPFIDSIFHFKHFMPDHSIERVVPDGNIYLIFELDGIERTLYNRDSLAENTIFTKFWLAGLQQHYISISAHENSEMFVIQFKAGGLKPFINEPVSQFSNRVVNAEMVFGESLVSLRQNLIENSDDSTAIFQLAEAFLLNLGRFEMTPQRYLIDEMINAIIHNSASKLTEIVANSNYSHKQAIHIFRQFVGLNPKTYQRIVRFTEILPLVKKKQSISWKQICADCYYYDQSHFIREFKNFCGYTPGVFLKEQQGHVANNFFPLD